jgi:hypothetical protein
VCVCVCVCVCVLPPHSDVGGGGRRCTKPKASSSAATSSILRIRDRPAMFCRLQDNEWASRRRWLHKVGAQVAGCKWQALHPVYAAGKQHKRAVPAGQALQVTEGSTLARLTAQASATRPGAWFARQIVRPTA